MVKNIYIFLLFSCLHFTSVAQDLNCRVSVNYSKVSTQDTRIFKILEEQITSFLNDRKWSPDHITSPERIEASVIITINKWDGNSAFEAGAQIQSSRPVFGTAYSTPMLNLNDKDWKFNYSEQESLEYNETATNNNNLALLLAFYANIILGMDYDSFAEETGTPFYTKAQQIVLQGQNTNNTGWNSFESNQNRYWLSENLLNPTFKPLRSVYYIYHRLGLDVMIENQEKGRNEMLRCIEMLEKPYRDKPNSFIMNLWFTAKNDEIANLLQRADGTRKVKTLEILKKIDPANYSKYDKK